MKYKFSAYGHKNIVGTHKTTLEFTKDKELTLKGDCILGVGADFDLNKIKELISSKKKEVKITIEATKKLKETILAQINQGFESCNEMVIRKSGFLSERTIATEANKAAFDLKRDLIAFLRNNDAKISVIIENNP